MTELIMSVVKFKVKEGCEDDFVAAWAEAPSTDCKFQRLLALDNNEYVSIAQTDISGVLKREDDGIPWLDTGSSPDSAVNWACKKAV